MFWPVDILKVQEETKIKNLRDNSFQKGLNEDEWFYRKGVVGDHKNHFTEEIDQKFDQYLAKYEKKYMPLVTSK